MNKKFFLLIPLLFFLFTEILFLINLFSEDINFFIKKFTNHPNNVEIIAVVGNSNSTRELRSGDIIQEIQGEKITSANQVDQIIETKKGSEVSVSFLRENSHLETTILIPSDYSDQNFGVLYRDTLRNDSITTAPLPMSLKFIVWFRVIYTFARIVLVISALTLIIKKKRLGYTLAYGYLLLIFAGIVWNVFR